MRGFAAGRAASDLYRGSDGAALARPCLGSVQPGHAAGAGRGRGSGRSLAVTIAQPISEPHAAPTTRPNGQPNTEPGAFSELRLVQALDELPADQQLNAKGACWIAQGPVAHPRAAEALNRHREIRRDRMAARDINQLPGHE